MTNGVSATLWSRGRERGRLLPDAAVYPAPTCNTQGHRNPLLKDAESSSFGESYIRDNIPPRWTRFFFFLRVSKIVPSWEYYILFFTQCPRKITGRSGEIRTGRENWSCAAAVWEGVKRKKKKRGSHSRNVFEEVRMAGSPPSLSLSAWTSTRQTNSTRTAPRHDHREPWDLGIPTYHIDHHYHHAL